MGTVCSLGATVRPSTYCSCEPGQRDGAVQSAHDAPAGTRKDLTPRAANAVVPWLTPEAEAETRRRIAKDSASEPVSYARRLAWYLGSRHAQMLLSTTSLLADETNTLVVRPFLNGLFLSAWGRQIGRTGFEGERRR